MSAPSVPFPRILTVGVPQGQDVIAVKRAVSRAGLWPWRTFDGYYTVAFSGAVKTFQKQHGLLSDGVYGQATHDKLRNTRCQAVPAEWAFDTTAIHLMQEAFLLQHPGIVCPVKFGNRPSFLHETGGIAGNWALDFMDPGGTSVYAPVDCHVTHLSGHDPHTGVHHGDIFGWSVHFTDTKGRTYFATHLGTRIGAGTQLRAGQKFGTIGSWPRDPGRSHLHLGVDAGSRSASQTWIKKIANAPRP